MTCKCRSASANKRIQPRRKVLKKTVKKKVAVKTGDANNNTINMFYDEL